MQPEELGEWMNRHAATLVLFARQYCASPEDVVQEAFVKLSIQRSEPEQILPWLYRVVRNGAISAGRAEQRRRKHELEVARRSPWFEFDPTLSLDAEIAGRALQNLPLEQREVVIAHLWSDLTFNQIADLLETSASRAHRLYQAALANLRERLELSCPKR